MTLKGACARPDLHRVWDATVQARQGGKKYAVMAWLYLPSLWSEEEVVLLSEGLAAALADVAQVEPSSVQVLTSILTSGSVVEVGTTLRW